MTTFKYRPHRGSIAASMMEVKEFFSKEEFMKFLRTQPFTVITETTLTCKPYKKDERISWEEVWIIKDAVGAIGFTNKNIDLFCQKALELKGKRVRKAFLLAKFPSFQAETSEETINRIQFLREVVEEAKTFVKSHSVKEIIFELDKLLTKGDKDRFFYIGLIFFQTLKQTHQLNSGEMNSPDFNPANCA